MKALINENERNSRLENVGELIMFVISRRAAILAARMGSQVFVPYRGLEDDFKHLKLMGDLGQVPGLTHSSPARNECLMDDF